MRKKWPLDFLVSFSSFSLRLFVSLVTLQAVESTRLCSSQPQSFNTTQRKKVITTAWTERYTSAAFHCFLWMRRDKRANPRELAVVTYNRNWEFLLELLFRFFKLGHFDGSLSVDPDILSTELGEVQISVAVSVTAQWIRPLFQHRLAFNGLPDWLLRLLQTKRQSSTLLVHTRDAAGCWLCPILDSKFHDRRMTIRMRDRETSCASLQIPWAPLRSGSIWASEC